MKSRRREAVASFAIAGVLVIAGCSSSDGAAPVESSPGESGPVESSPAESASAGSLPVESGPVESVQAGSVDPDVAPEVCEAAEEVEAALMVGDTAESDEDFVDAFDELATALEGFAEVAPDDIVDDATYFADATRTVATAASDPELDFDADPPAEITEVFEKEEYATSRINVNAYLLDTCALDIL